MPTNQQRRESERRRLQHQLEERRAREASRRQTTLIVSIVGTVVLIAAIIVVVVVATSSSKKKSPVAGGRTHSPTVSTSPTASAPVITTPTAPCASAPKAPKADTVSFQGVTVTGATDLKHAPTVKSASLLTPATLQCDDLVVGKGVPATPTSTVSVQYYGALYKDGTYFDSSWKRGGKPISFPLTGVVPGFTQGIGGAGKVAPMRVGGRRVMIIPAALGYGATGQGSIPPNAWLVFVVDLTKVS